jgi:hypothetical protein
MGKASALRPERRASPETIGYPGIGGASTVAGVLSHCLRGVKRERDYASRHRANSPALTRGVDQIGLSGG